MEPINIISEKKLVKEKLKTVNIKEKIAIPAIPGKVAVRSDEDIIKEYCSWRHKGGAIKYDKKRDYFYAT